MKVGLVIALIVVAVMGGSVAAYAMFAEVINEKLDQMVGTNVAEIMPKELDPRFHACEELADEAIELIDESISLARSAKSGEESPSTMLESVNKLQVEFSIIEERAYESECMAYDEGFAYSQYITSEQKEKMLEKGSILKRLI